jgi:YidC/Oxa1 family membrane protein insertase
MEKRIIVAFALSTLVMMAWFTLFQPAKKVSKPEVKTELTENKTTAQVSGTTSTSALPPSTPLPTTVSAAVPQIQIKEIIIETVLYKAVFSNVGPTIKSFQLKNYRQTMEAQAPLVELIDLKSDQDQSLVLSFIPTTGANPAKVVYESDAQENKIRLETGNAPRTLNFISTAPNGLTIEQTFTFYPDKYPIDLNVNIKNNGPAAVSGALEASWTNQLPKAQSRYTPFIGTAFLANGKLQQIDVKKLAKSEQSFSGKIGWLAFENGYFISAVAPEDQAEAHYQGKLINSNIVKASYTGSKITIANSTSNNYGFILYLGPRDIDILKSLGKKLELAVNFGWFDVIAKPFWYVLRFLYKYIPNYGVAIILLTILIKILFWPLTFKSYKSMKEMQKLQPHLTKLREKYKDNREQMNKEMMNLYRTYKINPLGGCLPMLVQLPVFYALYNVLRDSIELRHAPFMLWIKDLSAPDRLFNFPIQHIPSLDWIILPPYGIPVMTLLMGASMFITQKMTPSPGDPTQAKMMLFMPVIFTFFFINLPSGLVLYWLINNILSIGQQYQIMKKAA